MSETYDFPSASEIPTIDVSVDEDTFRPEQKHLFVSYNPDQWEDEKDAHRMVETLNYLFGSEIQVIIVDDDFEFLTKDDVKEMIGMMEDMIDDD